MLREISVSMKQLQRELSALTDRIISTGEVLRIEMEEGEAVVMLPFWLHNKLSDLASSREADYVHPVERGVWERLGYVRDTMGLRQREVPALLGVSASTYRRWRQEVRIPERNHARIQELAEFCKILDTYFLPDRVPALLRESVDTWEGQSALEMLAQRRDGEVRHRLPGILYEERV